MTNQTGFELLKEQHIREINTRARLFRHEKTGAQVLSLENEDDNKVFGINFFTPPPDSTGLPHIMEHCVLSGSRKYPVKEPFVELMKGSLNTFLNAMTYPDKTCYPVASQNLQDFYNLVDVYLDAVFYPLIPPQTLQQEGWHYELDSPGGTLSYKGVVFNEMKGVYSTPDSVLDEQSQHSLFPDTIYSLDSGGDPQVIPQLTYDQFKRFHENYYHPSNAFIFFYGNDDSQKRLEILKEYLDAFEPVEPPAEISLQPAFSEPRRLVVPYDSGSDSEGHKSYITLNWLLPETKDTEQMLALAILENILVQTPASPLRKVLIDSGLGEDLAGRGLENATRQMFFSTGMKGVERENIDRVEKMVLETLEALARDGIERDMVAASLNTIEFRLRENNTGSFPRGLALMLRSLSTWLYGGDPLEPLAFETPLAAVKARVEAGEPYFENLIRKHFLGNPHRTTVILEPDADLGRRREEAERRRLEQAGAQMTPDELAAVVESTGELKRLQEAPNNPEALASIPMLRREDLDRQIKRVPLEVEEQTARPLLFHELFTNGILYLDLGFDLRVLPQEWLPYLPLFAQGLVEMGTISEDFVKLSQRIGRSTGGIHPAWYTSAGSGDREGAAWFFLRGKAIASQSAELLNILGDVLTGVRWDNQERFRQIVLEAKASHETNLLQVGHAIINRRLRARFNPFDNAAEEMSGVSSLFHLRRVADKIEMDWPSVLGILEEMGSLLLNRENLILNVILDRESWQQVRPQLGSLVERLPSASLKYNQWNRGELPEAEGLAIPSQVNYVGKGLDLYEAGYQMHGSALVAVPYLRNTFIWDKVRVQGGAYGGLTVFDRLSGIMTFLSYRDPNLAGTLEVYNQAGQFLSGLEISDAELTKSIIGAIGDMDQYQLPDAQGYSSMLRYLTGITDEERQQLRDEVLATTPADFHRLGEALQNVKEARSVVVMGPVESLEAARRAGAAPLDITKVL